MLEKGFKIAAVIIASSVTTLFNVTLELVGGMSNMVDTISDIVTGD